MTGPPNSKSSNLTQHFEELRKLFLECHQGGQGQSSSTSALDDDCEECEYFIKLFKRHIETVHKPTESQHQELVSLAAPVTLTPVSRSNGPKPKKQQQEENKSGTPQMYRLRVRLTRLEDNVVNEQKSTSSGPSPSPPSGSRVKGQLLESQPSLKQNTSPEPNHENVLEVKQEESDSGDEDDRIESDDPDFYPDIDLREEIVPATPEPEPDKENEEGAAAAQPKQPMFITARNYPRIHCCSVCKEEYPSRQELLTHFVVQHGPPTSDLKPYRCTGYPPCSSMFSNYKNMSRHILLNHIEKRGKKFICTHENCTAAFRLASKLKIHSRTHIPGGKRFICEFCQKGFTQSSQLLYHTRHIHTNERPHQCETCGKKFVRGHQLTLHKNRTHLKIYKHFCPHQDCERSRIGFGSAGQLDDHIRIHTGEKRRFTCKFCNKGFSQSCQLLYHTRHIHTNERPHQCETCGKSFVRRSALNLHTKRTHLKISTHFCTFPECERSEGTGKGFGSQDQLTAHLRLHTGERPFICEHCSRSFRTRRSLRFHMDTLHGDKKGFPCEVEGCGWEFTTKITLTNHMKYHEGVRGHLCEECGQAFENLKKMESHQKKHA